MARLGDKASGLDMTLLPLRCRPATAGISIVIAVCLGDDGMGVFCVSECYVVF